MEKSKPVVVGIGELLWDVFPEVRRKPVERRLILCITLPN